jgi:hypothetical protein
MGNLVLTGATSGSATVQATDAQTVTITLPATSGTLAVTGGSPTYTSITTTNDASISGLTVGKGTGSGNANNTALGNGALAGTNTSGPSTAVGYRAMYVNSDGYGEAFGYQALYANTTGTSNVAVGYQSLVANTTGSSNVSLGPRALFSNTTASNNTAVGYQAGYSNTTGQYGTFIGYRAGYTNQTGGGNTFVGRLAGYTANGAANSFNCCIGDEAGYSLTTGVSNTFVGSGINYSCGASITTGSYNTIIGAYNGNQNGLDIRTASNYIVLSDGDGNPRMYHNGASGTLFVPDAYNYTTGAGVNTVIGTNGFIGRSTSALKYKQNIRDLESIDINKFRPVRYKSKCESDDQTIDHFGFIADEIDQAGIKELVQYNAEGEVEGFSYDRLTVVLVKAIQELNTKVTALEAQLGAK